MRRTIFALFVALALADCAALTPDSSPILSGSWGGPGMLLTGSDAVATARIQCLTAIIPGPIRLDPNSHFSVTGSVRDLVGLVSRISGRLRGDTLEVQFELQYPNGQWTPPDSYKVVFGTPVTWPDGRLCAL
jgi:hypothetical protein